MVDCIRVQAIVARELRIILPAAVIEYLKCGGNECSAFVRNGAGVDITLEFNFTLLGMHSSLTPGMERVGRSDTRTAYSISLALETSASGHCIPFVAENEEHLLIGLDALHAECEQNVRPKRVLLTEE